ncbi:MAG: hypothetical protein QOK36_277, partial [Gaiellales bacterium]|nr:hypothetical protein [Gaiellales bacterium]
VAALAVGPAGPSGTAGAGGAGTAGAPGAAGASGTAGAAASTGAAGAAGERGAAATPTGGMTAAILHPRLATPRGRRLTIHYAAAKGMRLVLSVRRRGGRSVARIAALTTRAAGRGSVTVRPAVAPGSYTLMLTLVASTGARVVDAIPLVVTKV